MQTRELLEEDFTILDRSSDETVALLCRNLDASSLEKLIAHDKRYGRLCGNEWVRRNERLPSLSHRGEEIFIEERRPRLSPPRVTFNQENQLKEAILNKEASLQPNEYLDISDARLEIDETGRQALHGVEVVRLPQKIPGYPRLVTNNQSYDRVKRILGTSGQTEHHNMPHIEEEIYASNGRPITMSDEEVKDAFRQAILQREASLGPNQALDLTNAKPGWMGRGGNGSFGAIGLKVIGLPQGNYRTQRVSLPGHPQLWVHRNLYQDYAHLFDFPLNQANGLSYVNQPLYTNQSRKGGCGCGK